MSKQTKLKFCRQGNKDKWEDLEYIYLSNLLNGLLGLSPLGGGRTFVLEMVISIHIYFNHIDQTLLIISVCFEEVFISWNKKYLVINNFTKDI